MFKIHQREKAKWSRCDFVYKAQEPYLSVNYALVGVPPFLK